MKKGECAVWTEGPGNRLRELWASGLTAEQCARMISKEFGFTATRNAVVGRIHRWHLPPRSEREEQKRTRVYAPREPEPIPPPGPDPMPEVIPTAPVRLVDAPKGACRWPLWDGYEDLFGDFLVCGAPTVEGTSWCRTHRRLAFSPQPKKREMAA